MSRMKNITFKVLLSMSLFLVIFSYSTIFARDIFFGHLNPDSDSVFAAIAAAYIFDGEAGVTGSVNNETAFILKEIKKKYRKENLVKKIVDEDFKLKDIYTKEYDEKGVKEKAKKTYSYGIVDFNSIRQAPQGILKNRIKYIIDHHTFQGDTVAPAGPIYIDAKPLGSACTVLYNIMEKYHDEKFKKMPDYIAFGILSAIVSDTLNLTSKITTDRDKEVYNNLVDKLRLGSDDFQLFASQMLKVKSDLKGMSADQIISYDYKLDSIKDPKAKEILYGFAVAETQNPEQIMEKEEKIKEIIRALKDEKIKLGLDYYFFSIIDIKKSDSYLFVVTANEKKVAGEIYKGKIKHGGNVIYLKGFSSRKSHFIPPLKRYFNESF
jgi:manganese-dependent inorganic pyrophosphatase